MAASRGGELPQNFNRNWGANWRPGTSSMAPATSPSPSRSCIKWRSLPPHTQHLRRLASHRVHAVLCPRPRADDELNARDLAVLRELGRKGEDATGFKLRAVTQYRLDEGRPNRLQGHFTDWAYEHLGIYPPRSGGHALSICRHYDRPVAFASKSDEERREFDRAILRWHDATPRPAPLSTGCPSSIRSWAGWRSADCA